MSGAVRSTLRRVHPLLAIVMLTLPMFSDAFTIEHVSTRYFERRYECELVLTVDAPLDRVLAVLRDYERYPALHPRILQAHVIERPQDGVALLETVVRACFGPFCRNVRRTERVEERALELSAYTDPARSDVRFGETHTRLEPLPGGGVRIDYHTSVSPGFWIPPLVGRRWMLRTLEDAALDLFRNVEKRAQEAPDPADAH